VARAFDGRDLGKKLKWLRAPLPELTVFGIMIGSGAELTHFMRWSKSARSALFVARRLLGHGAAQLFHGRGVRLTNGNALAGRLLKSALDAGVELWSGAPVRALTRDGNAVTGAVVERDGQPLHVRTRKGVVLACGGFPQDAERRARLFAHAEHFSPAPPGNTGDGLRLVQLAGARLDESLPNAAAWVPVSRVPRGGGAWGLFPHFIDRAKPGVVAVTRKGVRFVNEGDSYHDFVQALLKTGETHAWLVTDQRAIRAYGLGFVKPRPLPLGPHLKSGYLLCGETIGELARRAGIQLTLEDTVDKYNERAKMGSDPIFRKGENAYNRFYGDPDIKPNPCVAPLVRPPFYAVRVEIGDLGTYAGIVTNGNAQVLDEHKRPIPGLYAAGNDALSIMGGNYPGPGITLGPAMTFGWLAGRHLAGQD
jgi:succinate dehydrogenase/fumarate reductase flavoprotein subunit